MVDVLVMCGNEELGIYEGQFIWVRFNDYVVLFFIFDDYVYSIVVVNEVDEIVQVYFIVNFINGSMVIVDLVGLFIGDYGIYGFYYFIIDFDFVVFFDFSIGVSFLVIIDELMFNDGVDSIIDGLVCGDVSFM